MFKWLPTVNFYDMCNIFGKLSKTDQTTTDMLSAKSGTKYLTNSRKLGLLTKVVKLKDWISNRYFNTWYAIWHSNS